MAIDARCHFTGDECSHRRCRECEALEVQARLTVEAVFAAESLSKLRTRAQRECWRPERLREELARHSDITAEIKHRTVESARKRWLLRDL
ncbi:MAG TPA: hypothetical protein VGK50_04435 [Coriobacteriia bacterium]|jgi:hypothetical protein